MDEEFCSAMGWRNEPETSLCVPGSQNAGELHAWGLTFDMSGSRRQAKPAGGCPLDGVVRRLFAGWLSKERHVRLSGDLPSFDYLKSVDKRAHSRFSIREVGAFSC